MKSTPFNEDRDLAPIPFDTEVCNLAQKLKEHGLKWIPQVGCFVWDPGEVVAVPSPFPRRIYFVLNLNHFMKIFGSSEEMAEKLVWLPTWHQVRLLCEERKIPQKTIKEKLLKSDHWSLIEEIRPLYQLLLDDLQNS